jgi:hypothetical protein
MAGIVWDFKLPGRSQLAIRQLAALLSRLPFWEPDSTVELLRSETPAVAHPRSK